MVNPSLFSTASRLSRSTPNTTNEAGGSAFARTTEEQLAQYAVTACLGDAFYVSAEMQLEKLLELTRSVDSRFIAQLAVFSAKHGYMKDVPALLCAVLASRIPEEAKAYADQLRTYRRGGTREDREMAIAMNQVRGSVSADYLAAVFPQVITNGRMMRNFVQVIRSGRVGRKSFGTVSRGLIRNWIRNRPLEKLWADAVGEAPSLADIIRMVHPRPMTGAQNAFFAYLLGKDVSMKELPAVVRQYEAWKRKEAPMPGDAPFRYLTSQQLTPEEWRALARGMSWQALRQELVSLNRHGAFADPEFTRDMAAVLTDPQRVKAARVFPYQILAAYTAAQAAETPLPQVILGALHDAMELATMNVPVFSGDVTVAVDVSGSMSSPITGDRGSATSKVRCVDVAALFASCVLRVNPHARVIPFEQRPCTVRLEPRDTVLTNATRLAAVGGGGTNCPSVVEMLLHQGIKTDAVVYVSDNESWMHGDRHLNAVWEQYRHRINPKAKLVCIDVQSGSTVMAPTQRGVLNIGGFNDQVFTLVADFLAGDRDTMVDRVKQIDIPLPNRA